MTPAEVRYGTVDRDYGMALATKPADEDGPIWMVNLMRYRDQADYADAALGAGRAISGREADDAYAPRAVLQDIGAEIAFVAEVESQLLGAEPRWDRVGIVRYPTRRSFIEMQSRPDFKELHVHKDAGMASTIVMGCVPLDTRLPTAMPDWTAVPHPPTAEDGPVVLMHVLRFHDREQMRGYEAAAGGVAVPHGVRPTAWMDVEGTIVGDGRTWDQVRLNAFPSRRAFEAVAQDRTRLAAQAAHREPAIADTYTLVLRAVIDRMAELQPAS